MRSMKPARQIDRTLLYFGILAVLYLVLSLVLPTNPAAEASYHISSVEYHIILFFIIFPFVLIWLVAFYGYSNIRNYASVIEDTPEGTPIAHISNSMMWLAWGLPIPALIGLILSSIANGHPGFYGASIIISNYANLIIPVVAFHILSTGSRLWAEKENIRLSIGSIKLLVFLFVVIGALYCYQIFHNVLGSSGDPYHLPHWLLLVTIVIPYLYAWIMGFLAAYEIWMVSNHAKGLLYQQALRYVARGIVVTVASFIVLQYYRTALIPHTARFSLSYVLIVTYLMLIIIALGYGLLAYGARKLKKIEEV